MNAVRNAWRTWSRKELPTAAESLDNMGGGDDTYDIAAAESSAAAIVRELSPIERRVASLTMQGYTKKEMMDMGMSLRQINDSRASVKRLRSLLPDASNYSVLIRTPAAKSSDGDDDDNDDDTVRDMSPTSWIDNAFATLDFPPQHGSDCPPCWRCMWFEGFMPTGRRETRMKIEDAEVREAVKNTEARKIEIAQKVRDGIL